MLVGWEPGMHGVVGLLPSAVSVCTVRVGSGAHPTEDDADWRLQTATTGGLFLPRARGRVRRVGTCAHAD